MARVQLTIVSDIHYASAAERARAGFEWAHVTSRWVAVPVWLWRFLFWERTPFGSNGLLERFLAGAPASDLVIANGDYSCDSAFVGVSDEAAFASAAECLGKLRARFGPRLHATLGDHELGKIGLGTRLGGPRLASLARAQGELGVPAFWRLTVGRYVLLGVTSTLIALPVYAPELLPEERPEWDRRRAEHLAEVRRAFASLRPEERVLLFCHDPSALPFLGQEEEVRHRLGQIERTIIGHLHSPLVLGVAQALAGLPAVGWLGPFLRRATSGIARARHWRPFRVRLCPALRGVEVWPGGYLTAELDTDGASPARFVFHRLRRRGPAGV